MSPEPAPRTVPLPPTIQRALAQIATELGDMPRECARDHGELCLWKNRLARRLRGVMDMRVAVPAAPAAAGVQPKTIDLKLKSDVCRRAGRTATSRKGRVVRVEVRQLEMQI